MNAASIKIESEEDGFHLIVETDEDTFDFNIHGVVGELRAEVRREIEPWWREGQAVLASMHEGPSADPRKAYSLYDPKHPDFHENFSAIYDNREGK